MPKLINLFLLTICCSLTLLGQDSVWIKKDLEDFQTADGMSSYQEAAEYLAKRVETRRKQGPTTPELVENYHKIALWFMKGKDYQRALIYVDSTLVLRNQTAGVTITQIARTEYLKGEILLFSSNSYLSKKYYNQGLATLEKAIASGDSLGANLERIQHFTRRAAVSSWRTQDFLKADLLLSKLDFLNERGLKLGVSEKTTLLYQFDNIGAKATNYQKQGHHRLAYSEYKKSFLPKFDFIGSKARAFVKINMANNLSEAGENKDALPIALEAFDYFKSLPPQKNSGIVYSSAVLMTINEALGNYKEVLKILEASIPFLRIAKPSGKSSNLGYLFLRAAQAYADQGKFDQAADYFRQSINALVEDTTGTRIHQLPIIRNNTFYAAQDVFVEYLAVRQNAFLQEADAGNPEVLPLALETAFKLDSFLNRSRDQLALTASLNRFIEQERRHYAAAIDVALRLHQETGKDQYLEDAYYFASSQKSNLLNRYLNSPDLAQTMGVPQEVIDRQQDLELQVLILEQQLNTAAEVDKAALREELLALNRELDVQRETIAQDYPAFSQALRGYERLNLSAAQATLEPEQLVVEYFLSDSAVYVFTISQEGLEHYVLPRPDNLKDLVAEANTDPVAAAQLYRDIVAPVLAQKDGITRLQFIPDGDLWQVSFAALRNGDRFLIQDYAISYAYASAMLFSDRSGLDVGEGYLGNGISYEDIIRRINASPSRSAVGTQLRDLGPLPFASREVDEAAAIMGGTPRINAEATKARFLDEAPRAGILHLAMHGIAADNPMENALVFRGERDTFDLLTMQEVLARKFPAALTILSACHSGNGPLQQNEGVQSIGRAFMAAGSRSTITSAWEAQDEATYKILTAFYAELAAGVPLDVALQTATTAFLETETKANRKPVNWANLKLHGAVKPLEQSTWSWWMVGVGVLLVSLAGIWWWKR